LGQVLDRVDVVVWRWRDELDAGDGVPQPGNQICHLVGRELSAFTWFGSLDDFDLQLLGPGEILGSHAESGRRYLLHPIVGPVAIAQAVVVRGILTTLARVRPRTHPVHRDRQRRMRLRRERAKGHRGGHEPPTDVFGRLDLIQRDRIAQLYGQKITRPRGTACSVPGQEGLVTTLRCVRRLRFLSSPISHRPLQRHDDLWCPSVVFALLAETHPPMIRERCDLAGLVGRRVSRQHVLPQLLEADSPDR
jgi:hypothetical protein